MHTWEKPEHITNRVVDHPVIHIAQGTSKDQCIANLNGVGVARCAPKQETDKCSRNHTDEDKKPLRTFANTKDCASVESKA
tara:strand:+ start:1465 stop:1707 length:243 start_codon:yes stop_codon:yes gene_type:complete